MADPTIAAARDILGDALEELRTPLEGCSAEELNQPPTPDANGLAVLATHALGSTRSWLSLAVGAPPPERDRDAEFLVVVQDPAAFLATFDRAAAECRALLDTDEPFESSLPVQAMWGTYLGAEPVTAAWALLHAMEHLREHVGHAQLTRQLQTA
ncbi:MAG: DUF664 domain-containing protein [Actinomycetota bacterium]